MKRIRKLFEFCTVVGVGFLFLLIETDVTVHSQDRNVQLINVGIIAWLFLC